MYLCPQDGSLRQQMLKSPRAPRAPPFIQRRAEHAGFIFKSTFAAQYLQIVVHIAIWFKCNDLLLTNSSKLWQIPWHSALNCKFRFYDWIPRFRPRFLHRGNHRALHLMWNFAHYVYIMASSACLYKIYIINKVFTEFRLLISEFYYIITWCNLRKNSWRSVEQSFVLPARLKVKPRAFL